MVILGILLIIVGVAAILAALFVSEPGTGGELLGFDISTFEAFVVGVIAGAAILWGFSILRWGTKRGLAHRKERKELKVLNEKLERAESERRGDPHGDNRVGTDDHHNPDTKDERI